MFPVVYKEHAIIVSDSGVINWSMKILKVRP